jgi:hypothetical protein
VRSTLKASETASPDKISAGAGNVDDGSQWRFVGLLSSPMDRSCYQQILKSIAHEHRQLPSEAVRKQARKLRPASCRQLHFEPKAEFLVVAEDHVLVLKQLSAPR